MHFYVIAIAVVHSLIYPQLSHARCPAGFIAREGDNYCSPSNEFDNSIWHMCGKEPSLYGLNSSEPCMSFEDRIKLHDKFTEYCRKLKLPHLYQSTY